MSHVLTKEFFRTGFALAVPRGIPGWAAQDLPEKNPQVTPWPLFLSSGEQLAFLPFGATNFNCSQVTCYLKN